MSAYLAPGRLTPAVQRLDLLRARAERRRLEMASQSLSLGDSGWHWTDLKSPAAAAFRRAPLTGSVNRPCEAAQRCVACST